jgi:hypothetical protein
VEAPLAQKFCFGHSLPWYDTEIIDASLKGKYDLVLVDGPPTGDKLNRYPALPYLHKRLSERFSFYLDDASREGERVRTPPVGIRIRHPIQSIGAHHCLRQPGLPVQQHPPGVLTR